MAHQFLLHFHRSPSLVKKTPEGVAECVPTDVAYAAANSCRTNMSLLDWLQHSQDQILYLTGKSGCGKSSLLEAFVIPQLKSSAPSFVIFKIRAYQDPLNAVRQELCRPGVIWQQSAPGDTVPISTLLEIACADVAPRQFSLWSISSRNSSYSAMMSNRLILRHY